VDDCLPMTGTSIGLVPIALAAVVAGLLLVRVTRASRLPMVVLAVVAVAAIGLDTRPAAAGSNCHGAAPTSTIFSGTGAITTTTAAPPATSSTPPPTSTSQPPTSTTTPTTQPLATTTTQPATTTTSTTTTTIGGIAPVAVNDAAQGQVGGQTTIMVLANDQLGSPAATIDDFHAVRWTDILFTCGYVRSTGLFFCEFEAPGFAEYEYTISNEFGTSRATITITQGP
jgi:hypothetical protein